MTARPSELHRIFDTNQFRTIRRGIIKEAQELRESMQRELTEDELIDEEKLEIYDLPEDE